MVVQHNLTAMNSNRMLGVTSSAQAKSTEKLSSGYKINRAADDAAGLSISEKMRKQIRGLSQASLNAEDGISAVQTAEGALTEVHDMLQRMNELAVKSANGTNSEDDRQYIQDEIDQLVTEIDRVAETTKFNETYLLKGDITAAKEFTAVYATADVPSTATKVAANIYDKDGNALADGEAIATYLDANEGEKLYTTAPSEGTAATAANVQSTTAKALADAITTLTINSATATPSTVVGGLEIDLTSSKSGDTITIGGQTIAWTTDADTWGAAIAAKKDQIIAGADGTITDVTYDEDSNKLIITGADVAAGNKAKVALYNEDGSVAFAANAAMTDEEVAAIADYYTAAPSKGTVAVEGTDYTYTPADKPALYDVNGNKISENGLDAYLDIAEDGTATLKEGKALYTDDKAGNLLTDEDLDTYVATEQTKVASLDLDLHVGADATQNNQIEMTIETMSASGIGVDGLKVDGKDDTNALNAIETIKAAIQKVSTQRSALGAIQNRLEHTIANLDNVVENTTAAESQIRDTDMATEMVKYSNNNILAQAGQAMLAQANQSNQGVLSLLG